MGVFDAAGIVVTLPEVRELRISGAAAFATIAWRQEDSAGEAMHEFTCHYTLIDLDGAWRIAAVINEQDPEDLA